MSFNAAAAEHLETIAKLIEILGGDSFRAGAHSRAARAIEGLALDLEPLAKSANAKAELTAIDGIGKSMADKIIELATTGSMVDLSDLQAQVPSGLLELLDISGVGPKTIHVLWKQGGVENVAGLKKVIENGKILDLPRMGAKSVEKIKASILLMEEGSKRLGLGPATVVAGRVVERMKAAAKIEKVAVAGSLRRGKETAGDIDILVATAHPKEVTKAFISMEDVTAVLASGETKCSVRVRVSVVSRWDAWVEAEAGLAATGPMGPTVPTVPTVQVDLRVIPDEAWGAALMYFTGSKEFNVRLRQRALDMGFSLNEYGLFVDDDPNKELAPPHKRGIKPVASATEEAIFAKLGLPFIAPELREDKGEIEFAAKHQAAPAVLELSDVVAELHAHTTASDGVLSIAELAIEARRRGFHTIAVTDHSQSSAIAGGLKPEALRKHIAAVRAAAKADDSIAILSGSEVDILADGRLDYDDDLLAELDVVVASPHTALSQDSFTATKRLLAAIAHPMVHILAHPTGRLVLRRRGLEPDMAAIIAAVKEHEVALEINAHWMRLDLRDTHVRAAVDAGCLIAINCDVHEPGDFDNLGYGVSTGRRGWLPPAQCINCWPAKKLHAWLRSKRR